jgi:hypothetical protein
VTVDQFLGLVVRVLGTNRRPNLLMFIHQNKGTLSKRRRRDEYKELRDNEVDMLEKIVRDAFDGFDDDPTLTAGLVSAD